MITVRSTLSLKEESAQQLVRKHGAHHHRYFQEHPRLKSKRSKTAALETGLKSFQFSGNRSRKNSHVTGVGDACRSLNLTSEGD